MYLKRLEIQGFKSFADRVAIEFKKGITVIVGPNGCGKSNITDAVQWVLGEQSARSLRGYKMDDVIFSGTARRRPLGMAEVSLTFDNRERVLNLPFEEINITRRVYRSGEGEYFINKRLCRLRDIHELFAQCGISRAAFSITSQGKIDEFITVRPQERRIFLEEIAGVGSYRQRKTDALRRLKETEDSLARLQDILGELEKMRLPLKKKAEIAEQYQKLAQLLKEVESRLLEGQMAGITKREEALFEESQKLESTSLQVEQSILVLEDELREYKQGVSSRREAIDQKEEEFSDVQKVLQESHSANARLEEKIASCDLRGAELQARLAVIGQRKLETEQELAEIASACSKLESHQSQAKGDLAALEKEKIKWEAQKDEANRTWDRVDKETFEILHQKTGLVSDLQVLKNKKEVLVRQQESLAKKASEGRVRSDELEAKVHKAEELCNQHAAALKNAQSELEQGEKLVKSLNREQEKITSQLMSLRQKIDRAEERCRILKDAEKNKEGYQYGVKRILQALSQGARFDGESLSLVEELFSIDPAYGTALDTALGRAAHNFICTTPQAAQEAIAKLKKEKSGRASFFPLKALEHWVFHQDNPKPVKGLVGRLSDLVTCDQKYRKLAEYLLGRTHLVDNLKNASFLAEKNNYRYRVVTLEGDLIQAGGLFTGGGGRSRYPSPRRRKQEIIEIDTEIRKDGQLRASYQQRSEDLTVQIEKAKKGIHELKEKCRQLDDCWRNETQKVGAMQQELKRLTEFIENCRLEGEELRYHQQDLDQQVTIREQEIAQITALERASEVKRSDLEKARRDSEGKTQELLGRLSAAQVSYSTISQDLKHQEQKLQQIQQLLELRKQEQLQVQDDLAAFCAEKECLQEQEKILREQLDAYGRKKKEIKDNLTFRKKQVSARERFVDAKERRYLKLKEVALKSQQRLQNNTIKQQHLEDQKEQIFKQAAENKIKLNLDSDLRIPARKEEQSWKEEIARLKQIMESLGEINFTAPGEYIEVQDRARYLESQIKDLEEGKESLNKMISELDRIAAARFQKTFQEVKTSFQEFYRLLTEGGSADLVLTDEDNILETGIDICVVPRGKKPRYLSLLSGGEKSITGIAFLFAMLQSNPSPFYFLDEIEAFLDDANIGRFVNMLKNWSANYQLILISHRYQTMQIADHLYGVTMEEPGISKLVSVQLSEYTPDNSEKQIS